MNENESVETVELTYHTLPNMTIEKIEQCCPDGMEYLGFGEYYNHKSKKFFRSSDGAMNRFGGEVM